MTSEEVHQKLHGLLADQARGIRYTGPELSVTCVSRALGALQHALQHAYDTGIVTQELLLYRRECGNTPPVGCGPRPL